MIIPIRCFSCGKPIAHLWKDYVKLLEDGKSSKDALDSIKLKKFCCRSMVVSNVDVIDEIARFKKY